MGTLMLHCIYSDYIARSGDDNVPKDDFFLINTRSRISLSKDIAIAFENTQKHSTREDS